MKKVFALFAICSMHYQIQAQQPYPAAPPAPGNIIAIEYFVDQLTDFGSGTVLAGFTASPDINGFAGSINLTGLAPGLHRIYFRTKDINGKWSLTNNSFFDNYMVPVYPVAPAPATNITNMEYYIGNPGEFGSGTPITGFTSSPNVNGFATTINLTGVNPGNHRINLRSKDALGNWSHTNFDIFDNSASQPYPTAPAPVTNMVQLEYFIDNNDLGFGNCTQIPFTAGTNISNLNTNANITGLTPGVHRLFIRGKDANGKWSLTNLSIFDNSASAPYPVAPGPAPSIGNMEYFVDSDPGFGNATAITVPGNSGDISNYAINLTISGSLSTGTHYLYIRSKQNPWSVTNVIPFYSGTPLPLNWSFIKAQLVNNKTLVSWATLQENNTNRFEIEHSADGRNFIKFGELNAAGNSNSTKNYSYTHTTPVTGFNYYRIKQIDNDGQFTYSPIATVLKLSDQKQTTVAPNPVKSMLHVAEPALRYILSVEIYSADGALQMRKSLNADLQVYSLPVEKLLPGAYFLKVNYKNETETFRFIKE